MAAEWIWYPGEFEIKQLNELGGKRYLREIPQFPVWPSFGLYPSVKYGKEFTLSKPCVLRIKADGEFSLEVDRAGNFLPCTDGTLALEAGVHSLNVHVWNAEGKIPCLYVDSDEVWTDESWYCTLLEGKFIHVDAGGLYDENVSPNDYRLALRRREAVSVEKTDDGLLYDFGRETFGFIAVEGSNGKGKLKLYLGESKEEALDFEECELIDEIDLSSGKTQTRFTRAFRYITVVKEDEADYESLYQLFEYRNEPLQATFACEDAKLQQIWQVALDTFHLNTREFFYDGIKRDRWVWCGDAYQSGFFNRYAFWDEEVWKRTIVALSGKGKPERHINTIVDYTLYWLMGFYDYYRSTGDVVFVERWYQRFCDWLQFILDRTDADGYLVHAPDDWVFIDWSDCLTKDCERYSFLQMLLCASLRQVSELAAAIGKTEDADKYGEMSRKLKQKINDDFWMEDKGAYAYGIKDGASDGRVFRQQNVMAVFTEIADERQSKCILEKVLKNDEIPKITTPYMRFYEFTVLCQLGETAYVLEEIVKYFGGMIDLGATSFWEDYDGDMTGVEHYAMYGRKYGKSLCHAWGATPLWIFGRYVLGVETDGVRKQVSIKPWKEFSPDFTAEVPALGQLIRIEKKAQTWTILSPVNGFIYDGDKKYALVAGKAVTVKL